MTLEPIPVRESPFIKEGSTELYERLEAFLRTNPDRYGWDEENSLKFAKYFSRLRKAYADVVSVIDIYLGEGGDADGADLRLTKFQREKTFSKWLAAQEIGWLLHAADMTAGAYEMISGLNCDDLLDMSNIENH